MLTTLLTRLTDEIVTHIEIDCPTDVELCNAVTADADGGTLAEALTAAAELAGPGASPVAVNDPKWAAHHVTRTDLGEMATVDDDVTINIRVGVPAGADRDERVAWTASGYGWVGQLTDSYAIVGHDGGFVFGCSREDPNPIGPYVAACLASAHVFLTVRLRDYIAVPVRLDAWNFIVDDPRITADTTREGPAERDILGSAEPAYLTPAEPYDPDAATADAHGSTQVALDHVLAGVGAVGTALLQTLWACPNVTGRVVAVDADTAGVDLTNLNRCVIFRFDDVNKPKALTAKDRLNNAPMRRPEAVSVEGHLGGAEDFVFADTDLISAVDTPEAREALQNRYPRSAVQASTSDLRLEVLRVNPIVGGACLRCFNEPHTVTDEQLRKGLDVTDDAVVADHAAVLDVDPTDVKEWHRDPQCGRIGDAMLSRLRASPDTPAQFSVGFISVLAGVLLASQVIKDQLRQEAPATATGASDEPSLPPAAPPLTNETTRFAFTLSDPHALTNGSRPYQRDSECPACAPDVRRTVWLRRWAG